MLMLIGSQALQIRHSGQLPRVPGDVDFIGPYSEVESYAARLKFPQFYPIKAGKKMIGRGLEAKAVPIHEFEIAWAGSSGQELLSLVHDDPETGFTEAPWNNDVHVLVPSIDVLYALKRSHRFLKNSPHFLKTMRDLRMLETLGAKIPERYQDWYRRREKATYDYGHPNLNQGKMGFFSGDGVQYVYDHDSIHDAVKVFERPAYTFFQKDGAQVAVDRSKFDALPLEYQLASVLEESYVLALERSQIPFGNKLTPRQSFEKALMKVCTSITSGWWRQFAYEHYDDAIARYDDTYAAKFWAAVESGRVQKHAA